MGLTSDTVPATFADFILLHAKTHANFLTLAQVGHTSSVWAVGTVFGKPPWAIALYGKVPH